MQPETPVRRPPARSLTVPEMLLLVLVVSVCIYPAFAPFNTSRPTRISLDAPVVAERDAR